MPTSPKRTTTTPRTATNREPTAQDFARALVDALDPSRLMTRAGLAPDTWQTDVLRSGGDRIALLCGRQVGKSTVSAALALHTALYGAPSLVLLLSPSLRQSGELFKIVMRLYSRLGAPIEIAAESALRVEFRNGSRVVSLPGTEDTVRGFSGVALLVCDEASRIPDELYYSTRPMLATSGGRLVLLSTPAGKRGFFFEEWDHGSGWHRVRVPATECPRISARFLAEERAHLGEWWFRQEYGCEFMTTTDQLFSHDLVAQALDADAAPLWERDPLGPSA
jgi:hypothetical protein